MTSRRHIVGIALATGLMLAGGTGLAAADGTPTVSPAPATALPSKADCAAIAKSGQAPVVIRTTAANGAPVIFRCVAVPAVRGVVPKGAPQTGGGGLAAEVGSWG